MAKKEVAKKAYKVYKCPKCGKKSVVKGFCERCGKY